jgi:hypothetical protein
MKLWLDAQQSDHDVDVLYRTHSKVQIFDSFYHLSVDFPVTSSPLMLLRMCT